MTYPTPGTGTPPTGTPLVIVCAGAPWEDHGHADHRLTVELRRYADILWVHPPRSLLRPPWPGMTGRPEPTGVDGVSRLRPLAPPLHTRHGVRRITPVLVRAQIQQAVRRLGRTPTAVLDCRLGRTLRGWGPEVTTVLYGTDDYLAGAALMGRASRHLRDDEHQALAQADIVVAVSAQLAAHWLASAHATQHSRGQPRRVWVIPNGVDVAAYATVESATVPYQHASGELLPRPVAGVVGRFSARVDLGLLESLADAGLSLLLVGPHDPRWEPHRFARLVHRARVEWVGQRPFASLPGFLRHIDVGLTPYVDTEFNRHSFPLKTLEYLAAGRGVVTTDLPASRWLDTSLIRISPTGQDFVASVLAVGAARMAGEPESLVAARRAFAETHSWRRRAARVAEVVGLASVAARHAPEPGSP